MSAASIGRRRDRRAIGVGLTLAAVLAGGWLLQRSDVLPAATPAPLVDRTLQDRFDAAVILLQAGRHDEARSAWLRVIELAPRAPEAHVNLGYALLGLQRPAQARQSFETAIALNAMQANAYHGLALAHEAEGDLELAVGAMRSFVHLAPHEDSAHVRRARAAVWEWQEKLAAQRRVPGSGNRFPRLARTMTTP